MPYETGRDTFTSELMKGYNIYLLKVENSEVKWEFILEICPDVNEGIYIATQKQINKNTYVYKHYAF